MAVVGMALLAAMGRHLAGRVTGVDEAGRLADALRARGVLDLEAEPPLRVLRVPESEEWPGWRWKVEATLRSSADPGSPSVARLLDGMARESLAVAVAGKRPSGVMVDLRLAGGAVRRILWDRDGRRVQGAAPAPAPVAPPDPPPAPAPEGPR
jgi:hypothetical protein